MIKKNYYLFWFYIRQRIIKFEYFFVHNKVDFLFERILEEGYLFMHGGSSLYWFYSKSLETSNKISRLLADISETVKLCTMKGWLVFRFYGISTIVGYLSPNPFLLK